MSMNLLLQGCNVKNSSNAAFVDGEQANKNKCPLELRIFGDSRFQKDVYRGTFSPEGETFYFFKKVTPNEEDYRIYQSSNKNGNWSDPEWVNLGGEYSDLYPSISSDGMRLVFSSYRPVPDEYQSNQSKNAHIWYCDRENDQWGKPVFMEGVNEIGYYHSWVEFGWDNNIYFRKVSPDWTSKQTLYTKWDGTKYTEPEKFEEVEQLKTRLPDIEIAGGSPGPNNNLIFLDVVTLDSETGKRGSDIWLSMKVNQQWKDPVPLVGEVNQEGYDVFPFLSPSGDCFYFVRGFERFYNISFNQVIPL